jgi:hypothetical protein
MAAVPHMPTPNTDLTHALTELRLLVADLKGDIALSRQQAQNLEEKVEQVLDQTIKTNGRVTRLEAVYQYVVGAVAAIGVLSGLVGLKTLISILPR